MTKKPSGSPLTWRDPDDAPGWTDEQVARAELADGGRVLRPATGTLTRRRGRPKAESPKVHVSLRIEADVLERYRALGPGWQTRINDVLREGTDRFLPSASDGTADEPAVKPPRHALRSRSGAKRPSETSKVLRDPSATKADKAAAASLPTAGNAAGPKRATAKPPARKAIGKARAG